MDTCLGFNMAQSNMVCVLITLCSVFYISSIATALTALILAIDAYIGIYLFVSNNKNGVENYLNMI